MSSSTPIDAAAASSTDNDSTPRPPTTTEEPNESTPRPPPTTEEPYVKGDIEYVERNFKVIGNHALASMTPFIEIEIDDELGPFEHKWLKVYKNDEKDRKKKGKNTIWKRFQNKGALAQMSAVTVQYYRKANTDDDWKYSFDLP